jgi:hypothetical protein
MKPSEPVGTISIPLTPEQERQLQEHAATCEPCAKVNAGQAPTLLFEFGAAARAIALEAASNMPTPPDWLTPKEREVKATLAAHVFREHVDGRVGAPEAAEELAEMVSTAKRHGLTFPERSTIDAPPPPDLLEATRPEPSPYAKIYTNGEISPPSRIPTLRELCVLRPYVNFAGSGSLVAAMAFAIHAENRGTIPCPGRTVQGCGDGEDECELCKSEGEIPLSGPLPSEHPDPFVRDVIAAVGALAEAPVDENTQAAARLFGVLPEQVTPEMRVQAKIMLFGERYGKRAEPEDDPKLALRALAAYDNARHAPRAGLPPVPGDDLGSGPGGGPGVRRDEGHPMSRREIRDLIAVLNETVLPSPWKARETIMGGGSIEIFHPGDAGGGLLLQWGRKLTVIQPSKLPSGRFRGPVGDRIEIGDYHGRGWFDALVAGVKSGLHVFETRYQYAMKGTTP